MLMGEYHHTIDNKGRIIIPSKLRKDLSDNIIVTRGIEECLFIYSKDEWEKIVDKLNNLPFTKKDARAFVRFFLSGATDAEFDKQGRINIQKPLIDYAHIEKDCIVVGTGTRLEIWSKNKWDMFMNSAKENMSDIAENLFNDEVRL